MTPNLPTKKVSCVLVNKNLNDKSKKIIESLNISIVESIEIPTITDCTRFHPDMQFVLIADKFALVAKTAYDYYKNILTEFKLKSISGITSPYPYDSPLNFTIIGEHCFAANHQKHLIDNNFNIIKVKQGYTKCNICVLNKNSIITSDKSICHNAEKNGFRAYLLPCDEIILDGYKNGFWGGCSGLIDKDKIFFDGNIEELNCYNLLCDILEKEKIEPIYSREVSLTDTGSIIPLY